jgi:hypothetical protein
VCDFPSEVNTPVMLKIRQIPTILASARALSFIKKHTSGEKISSSRVCRIDVRRISKLERDTLQAMARVLTFIAERRERFVRVEVN